MIQSLPKLDPVKIRQSPYPSFVNFARK